MGNLKETLKQQKKNFKIILEGWKGIFLYCICKCQASKKHVTHHLCKGTPQELASEASAATQMRHPL